MKINIEIDLTPIEARKFLGLPDITPMQERLMKQLEAQMAKGLAMTDPETVLKTWLPMSVQGLDQMRQMVWDAAASVAGARGRGKGAKPDEK